MTPEEKAKELVTKFLDDPFTSQITTAGAKQCALIVCDEILFVIGEPSLFHETRRFWLDVKNHINND